jgi:hypothetical protein
MSHECVDMNYNSRITAIAHTLMGHELQFEINSNHSHTHATWTTTRDKQQSLTHLSDCCLSRIVVHVSWVCEWLLLISNCSSCPMSVWVIAVYLEFGTWTTIRDQQKSLTHSRHMNYNSRLTTITHTLTGHELQFEINSNHSHTQWVIAVYLEL